MTYGFLNKVIIALIIITYENTKSFGQILSNLIYVIFAYVKMF